MSAPREVVITGLGLVTPIGIGRADFWDSMLRGASGVRPIQLFDPSSLPVRIGAEVLNFDPKQYVKPRKSLKVMSREIQLGFAAAELACEDAKLTPSALDPDRFGVVFGADMIYFDPTELADLSRACMVDGKFDFNLWGEQAMSQLYPLWLLKSLPNMPACHIAIAQDARGPNNSITLGDVSGLLALMEAASIIERGQSDVIIAGASGSRIAPVVWVFRDDSQLSHRHDDPAGASRPFEADRDGAVNGEGAAAFILESRQHAEARGAKILGRILGYANTCEPRNGRPPAGRAIRSAITGSLAAAGLTPRDIGHVNAHGLGTVDHDQIEAQAIHDTLGDVPVVAPKSNFGNLGAAAGCVEMAVSLLAFEAGQVPVTINYDRPDPRCPIRIIHRVPCPVEQKTAMILNQATMGQSAALIIGGPDGP